MPEFVCERCSIICDGDPFEHERLTGHMPRARRIKTSTLEVRARTSSRGPVDWAAVRAAIKARREGDGERKEKRR